MTATSDLITFAECEERVEKAVRERTLECIRTVCGYCEGLSSVHVDGLGHHRHNGAFCMGDRLRKRWPHVDPLEGIRP